MKSLEDRISAIEGEIIKLRRELHKHPELGFAEFKTGEIVADYLEDCGYSVQRGIGGTGVIGTMLGRGGGRTMALRACLDALPIEEATGVDYASVNRGRMHACGHDGNMAVTLGAAKILAGYRDELQGNIKVIVQPSEENTGGAARIIQSSGLENPRVDAIVTPHIWAELSNGRLGLRKGAVMASSDLFHIRIKGTPGHGAWPHLAVDAIPIAAEVITSLQRLVSREVDPMKACALSIGRIQGGTAENIISETVEIHGTIRAFEESGRGHLEKRLREVTEGLAQAGRAACEITYRRVMPPVSNHPALVDFATAALQKVFPEDTVTADYPLTMGCEEFSLFQQIIPGIFLLIGNQEPEEAMIPIHSPSFLWHEENLAKGIKALSVIALEYTGTPFQAVD